VEDIKPMFLEKKKKIQPATILRRRIFTLINCEKCGLHPV
jgi:hypothetical protein